MIEICLFKMSTRSFQKVLCGPSLACTTMVSVGKTSQARMPQITKPSLQAISSLDPKWVIKNNGPHVWISPSCQSQVPVNTNGTQPIPKSILLILNPVLIDPIVV
jgi:hypothetical protein